MAPRAYLQKDAALARLGYGVLPHLLTVRAIEAHMTRNLAGGTQTREEWRLRTHLKATMLDRGDGHWRADRMSAAQDVDALIGGGPSVGGEEAVHQGPEPVQVGVLSGQ
ncbi:hypothetical protein ACIRVF_30445 [Kitasatospora sp. NPDC101157]|uniref:hypothetical protein n=1 Tax=Kitasatospora sp. NPDC101157 TaxID=3364098 RepID=UPI003806F986